MKLGLLFVLIFTLARPAAANEISKPLRVNILDKEISFIQDLISQGQNSEKLRNSLAKLKAERSELTGSKSLLAQNTTINNRSNSKKETSVQPKIKPRSPELDDIAFKVVSSRSRLRQIDQQLTQLPEDHPRRPKLVAEKQKIKQFLSYIDGGSKAKEPTVKIIEKVIEKAAHPGESAQFSAKGMLKWRTEFKNKTGYQSKNVDSKSSFRFRPSFYFNQEGLKVKISPQVIRNFGGDQVIPQVGNLTTAIETSGNTNNSELSIYEAFVSYKAMEHFNINVGREALGFGDQMVIGTLDWSTPGRSFDLVKLNYNDGTYNHDFFYSKLSDNLTNTEKSDDVDLYGAYFSRNKNGLLFDEFDLYYFNLNSKKASHLWGLIEMSTVGGRFKGLAGQLLYRLEGGYQAGSNVGDDAYQVDGELGVQTSALTASLGINQAGKNYRQLYPTAHKFLGFADLFGRRNIRSYVFHYVKPLRKWRIKFDFHWFERVNTSQPLYKVSGANGATYAQPTTEATDVGFEADLVFNYSPYTHTSIELGFSRFTPGSYFKDQSTANYDKEVDFAYLQLKSKF